MDTNKRFKACLAVLEKLPETDTSGSISFDLLTRIFYAGYNAGYGVGWNDATKEVLERE